ncbi:MAG: hypothetical protein PHI11_07630 [Gallionella sp.]|nr:hypothetical protein [Gallionella sp.]
MKTEYPHRHPMSRPPHLVVSISGHGFGHVAQTAPILNALHARCPAIRITVRTTVPIAHLRSRIHAPFTHLLSQGDIGMVMVSATEVDVAKSRVAYQHFHRDWEAKVSAEAALLRELEADLVFSNVGYLPLAGAQRSGIANVALCSLNWADIYRHTCGEDQIAQQIQACYARADAFLRTTPSMAMADLPNRLAVAPIADIGTNRRDELNQLLNLSPDEKLVLVSLGGIASRLPIEQWPRIAGVRWLVQRAWQVDHPDAIVFDDLPMSFSDVLASSDALLTKPGYGSFVEATASGVPILYAPRPDWPESPALIAWLQRHGVCREVAPTALQHGDLTASLVEIWATPRPVPIIPTGAAQVAEWIAAKIGCLA